MYEFKIEMGDPSNDGHGISEKYNIICNKSTEEIVEAYKKACAKTGLTFTENDSYHGKYDYRHPEYRDRKVCVEYEDSQISKLAIKILNENGIKISEDCDYLDPDEFLSLFMDFITIILPDLKYEIIPDKQKRLPLSIGYGLFNN